MADQTFAVHCGFFDAINSDRTYSADEMNRPYKRVISNGVFATPNGTPSTDLQVTASSGMNIICKKGEGLFGDKWFENPSGIAITVPSNTGTVPRIDSVLVQVDTRTSGRVGNIVYRTGTPASSPVPPAINQTEGVKEYRLANIRVNAGVSAITQSMITDRRGSSDCPWVTSLIYQVDTSTLYDQWQAAYAEYFEEEKAIWDAWYSQLTEDLDVSMTLDRHTNTVTTTAQTTGTIPIGLAYNHNTDILEVYINGLRAVEGTHYVVVDGDTSIQVENQLQIGQEVTFVVMRSVISGSATNIMVLLQELESQIAGVAGGTPTVVDSTSDMTDTEKIYILSTDGKWYYYSATAEDWVIGGTYGGVPTDTTLTQQGMAADAKSVGDALADKADTSDVTALDTRVTAVEADFDDFQTVINDALTYAENTNFANRIESPMQIFQFADASMGIIKFSGVVPYNGKFITSSGSDTFGFYNPYYGFAFEIASTNGGVFSVNSKPVGEVNESLDGITAISGTTESGWSSYTINLPKGSYIIFAYRKVDSGNIKVTTNNHYTISGAEFDSVQDHFLRYSERDADTDKGLVITKLENKLVSTTTGGVSDSTSYDTYYVASPVSMLNITCKNGFRTVITSKDPTSIASNGFLVSVVYSAAGSRVETFSIGLGQYAVISVAHTAGDIDIVTDYVKTFSLPTLRLTYQQKNSFYRIAKSGSATYLYIYMVSGNRIVGWELHNVPAAGSNSNTWQIGHVMGYDYDGQSLSNGVELVAGGEFELAFKEYGSADYCGGNNHGDENTIDFTLMIDGKIVDLANADSNYHAFDRIDAVEHAYVNRCDTPLENILKHQKIWVFENGTVKIRQSLEFLEALECDFLCCMLAANRSAFTHGVRQGRVGVEDMSTSSYDRISTSGNEMMYLMYGANATAKVTARTCDHTPKASLWINNAAALNKLYYNFYGQMPRTAVESGTVLWWESEYDIAYN